MSRNRLLAVKSPHGLKFVTHFASMMGVIASGPLIALAEPGATPAVNFGRDIRPILSENCFACHGPDEPARKAKLRLDTREGAFAELRRGGHAIVAGNPDESELFYRLAPDDKGDLMPPPETGKSLTPEQIDLIKRWIAQGAQWETHWAFVAPTRPDVPQVQDEKWVSNPIDAFIRSVQEQRGYEASALADRYTLIRRLSLDLLGLPPGVAEVNAFVSDESPDAYEKLVERLLASPHYGERMAQDWLDVARYGDTNGYHFDSDRSMWVYRDYVINAFNDNKPFDEFTIENIAGDLLPDATREQKVASGFNRNATYNEEGGADPDEFMVQYAVDRVNTTGTAFMGLTVSCAQCHDHKYDPLTQQEYYQLYAFFNSVEGERGAQGHDIALPPLLKLPTEEQRAQLAKLDEEKKATQQLIDQRPNEIGVELAAWEARSRAAIPDSDASRGLIAHFEMDAPGSKRVIDSSGQYRHGSYQGGEPNWVTGRVGGGLQFDGKGAVVNLGSLGDFERSDAFSYGGWAKPSGSGGVMIGRMDEADQHRGWDLGIVGGKLWAHVVHAWPKNALKVTSKASIPPNEWHHVMVTYDGSSTAAGLKLYINGKPQEVDVNADTLKDSIRTKTPSYLGKRSAGAPFHGVVDDVRIYDRFLTSTEVADLAGPATLNGVLVTAPELRTDEESKQLREYYLNNVDPTYAELKARLADVNGRRDTLDHDIPHTMVMKEMQERREAFILVRGDFQQPSTPVEPNVPAILPALPDDQPRNRIALAHWLVDPQHPLTSRVFVNRLWQHFFGTGIVKTSEDFGAQGEQPSHPELLDWLAVEFMENGWDVKHLVRLMVQSSTYRQSAAVKGRHYDDDPYNRMLYRAPRFRLAAEQVRDNALSIAGLINLEIGGSSVKPYQPDDFYGDKGRWTWEQSKGEDLYRRGLYTFWRRTTLYPSFQIFDAPNRESCTARRPRTNTPLQALVTLNDPVFVEASRVFGQRILNEGGRSLDDKLRFAFMTTVARPPTEREFAVLKDIYTEARETYFLDVHAAINLVSAGEYPSPEEINLVEHAAWTAVANALLNLDETVTRG